MINKDNNKQQKLGKH